MSQVFRLSARCEEKKCTHFDGSRCQLAVRIASMLPEVVDSLPACNIRPECRWFRQEGRAACLRCPQIMTGVHEADETLQKWPAFRSSTARCLRPVQRAMSPSGSGEREDVRRIAFGAARLALPAAPQRRWS